MGKRKMYNTTIDTDLIKEIKILAARFDKRQNDLLEEAIQDLLEKYKYQDEETPSLGISNG
jgi:predicted transcriptional regulator